MNSEGSSYFILICSLTSTSSSATAWVVARGGAASPLWADIHPPLSLQYRAKSETVSRAAFIP